MAAPVIGKRTRFSSQTAFIDKSDTLAVGLAFCFLPVLGNRELAAGYSATISGAPTFANTAYGPGVNTTGDTDRYTFSGVPDAPFLGPISVLWVGRMTATSGGYAYIGGKPNGTNLDNNAIPFTTYCTVTDGVGNFVLVRGGFGSSSTITPSLGNNTIVSNRDYVVLMTSPASLASASSGWRDGEYLISESTGTGSPTGRGVALTVGSRTGDNLATGNTTVMYAVWSRQLAQAESSRLWADPFCFLRY